MDIRQLQQWDPDALEKFASVNPITIVVDAMRALWLGAPAGNNVWGAVVGGLTLGIVEAMAVQFIPGTFGGSPWKDVWAFGLLILVLVFRPQGILGAKVVDRA